MLRSSTCESGPSGSQPNQAIASTTTIVHTGMQLGTCGLLHSMAHAWELAFSDTLTAVPLRCYLRLSMQ